MRRSESIIANILLVVCTIGLLLALSGELRQRTSRNRLTFYIEQPQSDYQYSNPSPHYGVPAQPKDDPIYST